MRSNMFPVSVRVLVYWWCSLITVGLNPGSGGLIFADARPDQGSYLTQTVYGFLDFTTTIGNTVMIFSPQSAAAVPPPPPKETASSVNAVINTKPIVSVVKETAIKPSKTTKSQQNKSSKSSNMPNSKSEINKATIKSTKVEIQPVIGTKVNVIGGGNSIVNLAPVVSSKVHIVAAPPVEKKAKQDIVTKVEVVANPVTKVQQPIISSHVEVQEEKKASIVTSSPSIVTSVVEVQADEEPAVIVGNNIGEPEYDFLSRQPSEVVEETYKVVNLKPSSKFRLKPRPTAGSGGDSKAKATKRSDHHPTGLVTKLGGTVVKDGITTVHETSVIGTYISGKYAQVLQSTSQVINNNAKHGKKSTNKINPSGTLRILKTAAPSIVKSNKHGNNRHLEPTPAGSINDETALPVEALFNSPNSIKQVGNRKQHSNSSNNGSFKRFKNRQREQEIEDNEAQEHDNDRSSNNSGGGKRSSKHRNTQQSSRKQHTTTTPRPQKYGRGSSSKSASLSVHSEQSTTPQPPSGKRYNSRKNKHRITTTSAPTTQESNSNAGSYSRRGFKPKLQAPTPVDSNGASTSLYKFKLNRSPGRWQYKTTPKPRISIRKQGDEDQPGDVQQDSGSNDVVTPQARSDENEGLVGSESIATIVDDESTTDNKLDNAFPLETIKVEISTPPDFKDIYYEIATIKSPYTFQVGSVKNTRYITVTSTFEKVFDRTEATIAPTVTEPLTENILATTSNYAKDNNYLDSSIATLPHLYLASDVETPPLETLTETFSTSQTMLKTHILPVIKGANETSSYTLVQTYLVSRMVTATKTLPPMEAYHFIPSKTLNEFNSHLDEAGSELHLELEFGDENDSDDERRGKKVFPKDLDLANIGSDISDLSDVDKARILESHLRSKKEQAVTTSKPVLPEQSPGLSPEQLQQLAFLRLLNPAAAGLNPVGQGQVITTSKPVFRIETLYESLVIPVVNGGNTKLSTISKSLGTVTKTDFEYGTSTLPGLPIPQVNPIFPPQQQAQFAVTSSPIIQNTVVTETESKILKLTFGAKTAYTTIFSTKVVPTVLTTYMTASVPVAATAAFPGYFPAPYPPFPYVG
ncbi:hypothetical protein AMK59_4366 [Oryctes borbonicus]|uniref:DUF4758 domain-containing protein n=1 Tax=Oryctes borbonicus TaxID=1629725 RepID=A0A0T6B9B8_9SCAR|nr:hypothetical protein AMK59_4366 [Oryctes borbonicus]